jgi:hypothetical protein
MTMEPALEMIPSGVGSVMPAGSAGIALWPALAPATAWLRVDWWRRSSARGWPEPSDWWHPAVDAVCELLVEGKPVDGALTRLGAVRAAYGATVTETVRDLTALWQAYASCEPATGTVTTMLQGWGDQTLAPALSEGWQDPMTGLATTGFLRGRLDEVCRAGAAWRYVFVVLEAPGTVAPLVRARRAASLAACLREAFHDGETLTSLGKTRVAALVRRDAVADGVSRLRDALTLRERIIDPSEVHVWLAEVPQERDFIPHAVRDLSAETTPLAASTL